MVLSGTDAAAPVSEAAPATAAPVKDDFRRAYRWAQAGYALIPAIAGLLVAAPAAAICWALFAANQPLAGNHLWYLVCVIPAALLILAGWVRFEKPAGLPVLKTDAPELFLLIDQLRTYLSAPAIDEVYLTDTFTVQCSQRPSRGLFGGFRNELVIGLPLLQSVSKAESAALIANELGHLSGRQGETAAYIHRARVTWQQMIARQPGQPLYLRAPFNLVAGAFGRKFLAVSADAERAAVFKADRFAAEIAGLANAASALQRLSIAEAFLAEYWLRTAQEPVLTPEPDLKPHREMANFLPRMTEWESAPATLEAALAVATSADPAHPTLASRLDALNVTPDLPPQVAQSAAKLLGPSLPRVLDHFDAAWRVAAAPSWRAAFDRLSPETKRLLDLDNAAAAHPLDLAPAMERARLAYFAGGLEEARGRYADLIEWHPEDARAVLAAGIAMVDAGEPEGAECLRQALALAARTDWTRANAEEWFAVGEALLGRGEDLGIDCLEQAIRIDPARTDMASFLVDRFLDADAAAVNAA